VKPLALRQAARQDLIAQPTRDLFGML